MSALTLPLDKHGIGKKKISSARARESLFEGASPPRNGQEVTREGLAELLAVANGGRAPAGGLPPSASPSSDFAEKMRDISRRARRRQEEAKARPRRENFVRLVKQGNPSRG